MDDKQFEALLSDAYQRSVSVHEGRLEGLEERVREELDRRLAPRTARRGWLAFPRLSMGLGFAVTAAVCLLLGWFGGALWGGPLGEGNYQNMTFVVALPEADSVAVVGDFSSWRPVNLERDKGGNWVLNLDLPPGRYEYAFVVDGVAWKPDPRADEYVKSYNATNSVKYVSKETS